jgi:Ni,Fe-hydrogenase III small subunit
MFVLLNHLHRLRTAIAAPTPGRRGSLALRHVDAGSCNGCEHELTAAASPFYDLQQYGLNIVASPRHADVLLVTGAITTRMVPALRAAYDAMPEPRLVAALGDCALGCNVLGLPEDLAGPLEDIVAVDLRIGGCPPAPAAIADALVAALHQRDVGRPRSTRPPTAVRD